MTLGYHFGREVLEAFLTVAESILSKKLKGGNENEQGKKKKTQLLYS